MLTVRGGRAITAIEPNHKSVTFVSTGLGPGGAETQLVAVATRLKQRGWDVCIVSMLPPKAWLSELRAASIPVACLDMRRGIPDPRAILRLARALQNWQPQVVHSHMVHANLLARLTRLLYRAPVLVSTAHNIDERGRWRELAYRATDFLADLTTNVSQAAVDRYVRVGAAPTQRIRLMVNGVDLSRYQPDPHARAELRKQLGLDGNFGWLAVGRFEAAKDYPNMLRAFRQVAEGREDTLLLIAGEGSLRDSTAQLRDQLGLGHRIRFLGLRDDVPALLNAADGFILSSAWEGLPMVLLEALATGTPAVATRVGGVPEIVQHCQSGYVVPSKDSNSLAAAMHRLMGLSKETREAMGQAGRRHVQEVFGIEKVVDRWEALYEELLAKAGVSL